MTKRRIGAVLIAGGIAGILLFAGPVGVWGLGLTVIFPAMLLGGVALRWDEPQRLLERGGAWR